MGVTAYPWTPEFQWHVASLAGGHRKFYDRLGVYLDPERISEAGPRAVIESVKTISPGAMSGPGDLIVVTQHLYTRAVGKTLSYDLLEVIKSKLVDPATLDWERVLDVAALVVKYFERDKAANDLITAFTSGEEDLARHATAVETIAAIGKESVTLGEPMDGNEFLTEKAFYTKRRPLGIRGLDDAFGGGVIDPGFITWGARDKGGKSMALTSHAARDFETGYVVAFATMELAPKIQRMRIGAALAKVAIESIRVGDLNANRQVAEAIEVAQRKGGVLLIQEFKGAGTTMQNIVRWVDTVEQELGRKIDTLITDYAGKIQDMSVKGTYHEKMNVWQAHYDLAHEGNRLVVTAAQGVRSMSKVTEKGVAPLMTAADFADSQHIVRIVDHAITISQRADKQATMFICCDRHFGAGGTAVGPFPTAFDIGHVFDPRLQEPFDDFDLDMFPAGVH